MTPEVQKKLRRSKFFAVWYICIGMGFFLLGLRVLLVLGWTSGVALRWVIAAGFVVLGVIELRSQKAVQRQFPPSAGILPLLFLLAGFSPLGIMAQQARWPVESMAVEGNRRYSQEQVLRVAGLKVGQIAGEKEFEEARERLLATGAFDGIGYRFEPSASGRGFAATFQVDEVADVYPFRFDRLEAPAAELKERLSSSDPLFGEEIPATEVWLSRYSRVLEEFLAERGVAEKVIGKLEADAPGRLTIVFQPAAPPPRVAEVRFVNIEEIPLKALQNAIAGVAIGSAYTETRFRQLLENNIRPLYEARGRIRVAFPSIHVEQAGDVAGLVVTVEVSEGESYELGEVRFDGEELPEDELRRAGNLKTGEIANFNEVRDGVERILTQLRRGGYMKPTVEVARNVNDADKKVDLLIHVDKGPQYVFGKLEIQGLEIHGAAAVRRLWGMQTRAPFNAGYPEYFLQRIREDRIFDNLGKTSSVVDIDEQTHTVNVTLVFH